ncbi:MAG: DUF493 domain-containing protein [Chloroflexi bacterium]|jgi:putative lipoic acid-binding regulatory protein|nr:DUF493 domain-containing protein [Chloroflexota bacterium]
MTEENELKLEFPCNFPMKVIGNNSEIFEKEVYEVLEANGVSIDPSMVQCKLSSGDKYCSMSFEFEAKTREQVDQIYIDLTADPNVKWIL